MDMHKTALDAEKSLEQLATELAEAGVDPKTVKAVTQMAEVMRQVVSALGKGQEESGNNEPPPEGAPNSFDQATAETHEAMQASAKP